MLRRYQQELRTALLARAAGQFDHAQVNGALTSQDQIAIYHNHYRFTLIEAMKATFPVLVRLAGEAQFSAMAYRFIEENPPSVPCLFEYGGKFPAMLAASPWGDSHPYLPDVAALEWAINLSYHACDRVPLPLSVLAGLPPERLAASRLKLHPTVHHLTSPYPVDTIWRANQPDGDPETVVDLGAGGTRLVIFRRDVDVEWRSLDEPESAFIAAIADGATISLAHERAADAGGFDLAATLAWTFQAGLFIDPQTEPPRTDPKESRP